MFEEEAKPPQFQREQTSHEWTGCCSETYDNRADAWQQGGLITASSC